MLFLFLAKVWLKKIVENPPRKEKSFKMEKIVWFSVIGNGVWLKNIGIQVPFDGIKVQALYGAGFERG